MLIEHYSRSSYLLAHLNAIKTLNDEVAFKYMLFVPLFKFLVTDVVKIHCVGVTVFPIA